MTHGIWIHVDHAVVILERFAVLKQSVINRNVEQMKFLLHQPINVVPDAKRVSISIDVYNNLKLEIVIYLCMIAIDDFNSMF